MQISSNPVHFGTVSRTPPDNLKPLTEFDVLPYQGKTFYVSNGPNDTDMTDLQRVTTALDKAFRQYQNAHNISRDNKETMTQILRQAWVNAFKEEQRVYCALLQKVGITAKPIEP